MRLITYHVLLAATLLLCCSCSVCKKPCLKEASGTVSSDSIQPDDTVKHLFGDSISRIIFEPDSIRLLKLSVSRPPKSPDIHPDGPDTAACATLHGCYVTKEYGTLTQADTHLLLFLMSDRSNYYPEGVQAQSPFLPDIAVAIYKGNAHVDVIFSFTGGQMEIYTEEGERKYVKYAYERLLMLFFQRYLKDEKLEKMLRLNL